VLQPISNVVKIHFHIRVKYENNFRRGQKFARNRLGRFSPYVIYVRAMFPCCRFKRSNYTRATDIRLDEVSLKIIPANYENCLERTNISNLYEIYAHREQR